MSNVNLRWNWSMSQTDENKAIQCPLCGGDVESGYVPDYAHGQILQATWAEGETQPRFFGGIKRPGGTQIPLEAYRCISCGYVMLFARKPS